MHRDVSPHNVLISISGEVKLADFGIAKVSDARTSTRTGMVRGKPAYLAPEMFDGVPASTSTDVFAAGVTIVQLATLRSPFRRETDAATMKAVMTEPLPELSLVRGDLPPGFEAAVRHATARDPAQRTPTARQLQLEVPAIYGAAAARELGALVSSLAAEAVQQLESRAAQTTQLARAGTREASISVPISIEPPRVFRKPWALFALVPVLLLAGALAAKWFAPGEQLPALPVQVPVPPVVIAPAPVPTPVEPVPVVDEPTPVAVVKVARPISKPSGPRIGYLTVDASPWASVRVRGRTIGDTPLYKFPLDEGDVTVELSNPESKTSVTRKVRVTRGKETSLKVQMP